MQTSTSSAQGGPYRVMVVDDSAIIRGFLCRYLAEDPQIEVVTTANNGAVALRQMDIFDIEAIVLDIEMPEMDGMTALPLMIEKKPDVKVVMASTLTRKNAEISLRAMQMGAMDYVPKPETARSVNANIDFRRELVEKVKAWASTRRKKRGEALPKSSDSPAAGSETGAVAGFAKPKGRPASPGFVTAAPRRAARPVISVSSAREKEPTPIVEETSGKINLVPGSTRRPRVLAIGSSTGGPQALMKFFAGFTKQPEVPILITQHMPATFTAILATHLAQATKWPAQEGKDGMQLVPGNIYVAPGGKHMEAVEKDGNLVARLTDDPPENFCKPAVDPMFRSLTKIFGERILAVILTGMGHDGLKGARDMTRAGGTVYAQDEASSVVWGMPGAVATAGLCTQVLPIDKLGQAIEQRLQGGIG